MIFESYSCAPVLDSSDVSGNATSASSTVTLVSDYDFGATGVTVNKDLTLDLNGHAITYSGKTAGTGGITVSGSANFTITGVEGSTLTSTGTSMNAYAIFNSGTSTVTVSGGTVSSKNNYAIYNESTGIINVTGGVVMTGLLYAILNADAGTINAVEKYALTLKKGSSALGKGIAVSEIVLTPNSSYGMNDVTTDVNGTIYCWLPYGTPTTQISVTVPSSEGTAAGTYTSGDTPISGKTADLIKEGPSITVGTQPTATTTVTYGAITGTLLVAGTADNSNPVSYQWYKNVTNSATGGTAVTGATSASFTIPTTLDAGTHYYYCVLSATDCADKASNVSTVTVNKANATNEMKTVAATVSKNGATGATVTLPTTTVTDKNIADAVQAAMDAANKKGVNAGEVTAVINVTAPANSNPNMVTVNLPKTVQQQIINNKIGNLAIVIDKPEISLILRQMPTMPLM